MMMMMGVEEPVREEGPVDGRWGFGSPHNLAGALIVMFTAVIVQNSRPWNINPST